MFQNNKFIDSVDNKNKIIFHILLFFLLIFIQIGYSKNYIFSILLLNFIFLIIDNCKFSYFLYNFFLPLLILFIFSFFCGIKYLFEDIDRFIKDLIIYLQPILVIVFGYYIIDKYISFINFLRIAIIATSLTSLLKLSYFLFYNGFNFKPIIFFILTDKITWFNFSQLYAFLFLLIGYKFHLNIFKKSYFKYIFLFSILCILFSVSRTTYFIFIIIIIIININIKFLSKINNFIWIFILFILFTLFGSVYLNIRKNSFNEVSISNKIANSISEVLITNKFYTKSEIIVNYRSYEALLGLNKYNESNLFTKFFGFGFGSSVKRPSWIFPDTSSYLDNIPFFHNGYVSILFKSGIIGLILFFIFIFKISHLSKNLLVLNTTLSLVLFKLLIIFILIILLSTYVIHGIYKPGFVEYFIPFSIIGYSLKKYLQNTWTYQ
jgi:hypothetical protein